MDYYTILTHKKLLTDDLAGLRVDTVRRYGDHAVFVGFHGEKAVKLVARPDMPYLHRIERRFVPVRNAREWFPSRFAGSVMESVDITPGERVLGFRFDCGYRIVFEMTGRNANIIVVDPDGVVAEAVRKVTGRQSGVREIRSGVEYLPPPKRDFPDLMWSPPHKLAGLIAGADGSIGEVFADRLFCGSRLFAREAAVRAGFDPDAPVHSLDAESVESILAVAAEMQAAVEGGGDGGMIVRGGDGLPKDVFPLRLESAGAGSEHIAVLDDAVRKYSIERETGLERKQLRQSILSSLAREEKSLAETMRKIARERGGDDEPEILERRGNTILANLHIVSKGMATAMLSDPYGGGDIEVELDPTLDGPSNAEHLFSRSRKLKAASKRAVERLEYLRRRLETVSAERRAMEGIDDLAILREKAAVLNRRTAGQGEADPDRPFPRRFASVSGLEIVVGRNDKENDELIKWARKNDLWLHAQGVGGSHVVLRTTGRDHKPDRRSVEQAAAIAAYYSKARTSAIVPVVSTPVKYVIKRKGQGPGQVTYTRENVVFVEPGLPKSAPPDDDRQ